jgi:hypothetical protein
MDEHELRAALADHTITHSSGTYRAALAGRRDHPTQTAAVHLDFTAAVVDHVRDPIRFELHLSLDSFNDRAYLLEAIDDTVIKILDDRLPPGTMELL